MDSFLYRNQHVDVFSMRLDIIRRHDERAEEARQYIARIYRNNYQATINSNPDIIIASKDMISGKLVACTGISFAAPGQHLFSERYLDASLDEVILQKTGHVLSRHQVVEIGSLASDNSNAAADLIRLAPIIAWFMGSKAILCTSTHRLRKLFAFHQIPFVMLADASSDRLSAEERETWGSYYDQEPQAGVILLDQCGHLVNRFCGRLIYSGFEHLGSSALGTSRAAA